METQVLAPMSRVLSELGRVDRSRMWVNGSIKHEVTGCQLDMSRSNKMWRVWRIERGWKKYLGSPEELDCSILSESSWMRRERVSRVPLAAAATLRQSGRSTMSRPYG